MKITQCYDNIFKYEVLQQMSGWLGWATLQFFIQQNSKEKQILEEYMAMPHNPFKETNIGGMSLLTWDPSCVMSDIYMVIVFSVVRTATFVFVGDDDSSALV